MSPLPICSSNRNNIYIVLAFVCEKGKKKETAFCAYPMVFTLDGGMPYLFLKEVEKAETD